MVLFFWQRGFYWDEFPWAWIYYRLGPDAHQNLHDQPSLLGHDLSVDLASDWSEPVGVAIACNSFALGHSRIALEILRVLWPAHPKPAFGQVYFSLFTPAWGSNFIALMYSHFYIVLSCFLLSIYFSILAIKDEKRRWFYFAHRICLLRSTCLRWNIFISSNLRAFFFSGSCCRVTTKNAFKNPFCIFCRIFLSLRRHVLAHVLLHLPECQLFLCDPGCKIRENFFAGILLLPESMSCSVSGGPCTKSGCCLFSPLALLDLDRSHCL
jgi:hypothetical protein